MRTGLNPHFTPALHSMFGLRTIRVKTLEIKLTVTGGILPFTAYLRKIGPGRYAQSDRFGEVIKPRFR